MITSAGILMYRFRDRDIEVLLVHPGGPYWAKKDSGAWSIPKGEYTGEEDPLAAARREFREETGVDADGEFLELTPLKQRSGKVVACWAVEGDLDAGAIVSNLFEMQWPPRSGRKASFPEVDRAGWFTAAAAMEKILPGQAGFISELQRRIQAGRRD